MKTSLTTLFVFLISTSAWAFTPYDSNGLTFEQRVELIKELKDFISDFEKENVPADVSYEPMRFMDLIEKAYADDVDFNCFYGGWPSNLVNNANGKKKLCTNPKKSPLYLNASCGKDQLACHPILFGKGLCISFKSQSEKLRAFANCEKKFIAEKKGDYSYVNNLKGDDIDQLKFYVKLVNKLCTNKNANYKSIAYNCSRIDNKLQLMNKAALIKQGLKDKPKPPVVVVSKPKPVVTATATPVPTVAPVDCPNCNKQPEPEISTGNLDDLNDNINVIDSGAMAELYKKFKKDYEDSPLCSPANNYPDNLVDLHALKSISTYARFMRKSVAGSDNKAQNYYNMIVPTIGATSDELQEMEQAYRLMNQTNSDSDYYKFTARLKQIALKKFKTNRKLANNLAETTYLQQKILNDDYSCPFMSLDAFTKAVKGYNHPDLKNKSKKPYLTVVDYTMPSYQRRMFVLDMKTGKVMHNTWGAQGSGIGNVPESSISSYSDKTSIAFSNHDGTHLSSEGFYVTERADLGNDYGPNIILNGVDANNSNAKGRAIVLHGDKEGNKQNGGKYSAMTVFPDAKDIIAEDILLLKQNGLDGANDQAIANAANAPDGMILSTDMMQSFGCFGVPDMDAYDRKTGTKTSQLQSLRRDLADGSIIFSYSGENQNSKYYK
jgi:hypothetical protein